MSFALEANIFVCTELKCNSQCRTHYFLNRLRSPSVELAHSVPCLLYPPPPQKCRHILWHSSWNFPGLQPSWPLGFSGVEPWMACVLDPRWAHAHPPPVLVWTAIFALSIFSLQMFMLCLKLFWISCKCYLPLINHLWINCVENNPIGKEKN